MNPDMRQELRLRARIAWNNYPDTPLAREPLLKRENPLDDLYDPASTEGWDRVIDAIIRTIIEFDQQSPTDASFQGGNMVPTSDPEPQEARIVRSPLPIDAELKTMLDQIAAQMEKKP